VTLRIFSFTPAIPANNPPVVFVAGWITMIVGWREVLQEMTKDFTIYYIETREKISSQINGKKGRLNYGVEAIAQDIVKLIDHFRLTDKNYLLFGSSLGATAILECYRFLKQRPLSLILIGPNAVFHIPKWGMVIIRLLPPRLYLMIKPVVKWYLRTFRLDVNSDYAQYAKYCIALDAADPWKLRKGAIQLSKYKVWDILKDIDCPTLIAGASKDVLHEPQNLKMMAAKMPKATYLDMETNTRTHRMEMVVEMRKFIKSIL